MKRGEITFFRRKFFVAQYRKFSLGNSADKIRRRTLLCFERILVSKNFQQRRGKLHGFVENLSHRTEKISPGNHSVFQNFSGREKSLWIRGWGGELSQFSVENCLSHCTKIFHWRTLWFFRKNFFRKFLSIGGGHHGFVEIFCLTGPKRKAL